MRRAAIVYVAAVVLVRGAAAYAQDPPPPIPHFVVDLHGVVPVFPNDAQQLADSRGLKAITELPGPGLGFRVGGHVYFYKWKAATIGVGGEVMVGTSSSTPATDTLPAADGVTTLPLVPVDERLTSVASQLSFNFGSGHGWSFVSGGIGRSHWSLVPSGQTATGADTESLPTFNYGGGARWFAKKHLAFSFDVRLYEVQGGTSFNGHPGSPRIRLFTIGAGISLK